MGHLSLIRILPAAGRHGEARRRHELYVKRVRDITVDPVPWPVRP